MPKPHIETPSDRCRVCRCNFKVKFGTASKPEKSSYISSENLFKPSKRREFYGKLLTDTCREVGLEVVENSALFSDRVSNPCSWKIQNLGTLLKLIWSLIGSHSLSQDCLCQFPSLRKDFSKVFAI